MIRGKKQKMVPPTVERTVQTSIHNRFDLEIIDVRTGTIKQQVQAENVICNNAWTYMLNKVVTWNNYVHYGTGVGTPSSGDTSLFGFEGSLQTSLNNIDFDPIEKILTVKKKAQMAETIAVGKTLSEIGIAQGSSSNTLCTHAMLKDMNGNPVSIEKTDTDVINIYATVYVHFNVPQGTNMCGSYFNASSNGSYQIASRFAGIHANNYFSVGPGYGVVACNRAKTCGTAVGDASARTLTFTMNRWGVNDHNISGSKVLFLGGCSGANDTTWWRPFEFAFEVCDGNGWFEKSTVSAEALGTGDGSTVDFATAFPWAKNAKVYVDGAQVPAEVEYRDHKHAGGLTSFFKFIRAKRPGVGGFSTTDATISYGRYGNNGIFLFPNNTTNPDYWPVLENTLYESVGIKSMYYYNTSSSYNIGGVECSNDLINWVSLTPPNGKYTFPEEYQNYRYWRFQGNTLINSAGPQWKHTLEANASMPSGYNVHLETPPAEGSVITIDYDCDCIAKDSNHVFDFKVTFKLNEHSETL